MSGTLWYQVARDIPTLVLRTVLLYGLVLATMRWTGKRTVATMAPFDLALMIMISEVASIPITELDLDLAHGLVPVVILGALHVLVTTLNLHSRRFEAFTEGRPTLLIHRGRVLTENLRRERVSLADLSAALRLQQVTHLEQVEAAWLEPGGGVSVILQPADRPLTVRDLLALTGRPAASARPGQPPEGERPGRPGSSAGLPGATRGPAPAGPTPGALLASGAESFGHPGVENPATGSPGPGPGDPFAADLLPGLEDYVDAVSGRSGSSEGRLGPGRSGQGHGRRGAASGWQEPAGGPLMGDSDHGQPVGVSDPPEGDPCWQDLDG